MNLKQHTSVMTADEQEVGRMDRVIIEPRTKEVTHIVVHKGHVLGEDDDKLVPVSLIESANEQRVTLREESGRFQALPAFEEKVKGTGGKGQFMNTPGATATPVAKLNIPDDAVVVSSAAKVISIDDKQVGNIEEVQIEPQADRATYFVISEGLLMKNRKLVPISWVGNILDDEVHLTVSAKMVSDLHNYSG